MLSSGIFYGFLAMLAYGTANGLSQVPSKELGARTTIFLRGVIMTLFFGILLFFSSPRYDTSGILIALAIAALGYIPLYLFYKAVQKGKIGVVAPVADSAVVFTVLYSVLWYGEQFSLGQGIALVLIVLGLIFLSLNVQEWRRSELFSLKSGVPYAIVCSLLWGVVYFLLKIPTVTLGPVLTTLLLEGGVTVVAGVHMVALREKITRPTRRLWWYVAALGVAVGVGSLCYTLGLEAAPVSVVAPITFSAPLLSVLYGRIVFSERLRNLQYLGILSVVAGIVLVFVM